MPDRSFHLKSLWGLVPLGGAFTLAAFYSFYPSLGTFAPYVWVAFLIFALGFLGFAYLPSKVKKAFSPKAFKSKKLTNLYLYWAIPEKRVLLIRRVLYLALVLVFFVRFYFNGPLENGMDRDALEEINRLQCDFMNPFEVAISSIFGGLWIGAVIMIGVVEFYPTKMLIDIRKFVVTPAVLIMATFFPYLTMGVVGNVAELGFQYRSLLMAIELGLMLSYCLDDWRVNSSFKTTAEERYAIYVGLFLFLVCDLQAYTIKNLYGESTKYLPLALDFNVTHRLFLYICFALPILYFVLLHRFDKLHRRALLTFISYGAMFGYISIERYGIWSSITGWPFHICNTAMYTMPLTLVFHSYGLFYFTMFINVIGALLALLMPNYSAAQAAFSPSVIHFYINHYYAFFFPVLIICLGIYERPKMKYFAYSMIGFALYFILVASIDTYFTPHLPKGKTIDFFFINSTFIADKLGNWAKNIFNTTTVFTKDGYTYTIHWLYLLLYYLTYCGLSFAMWFVYELLFKGVDDLSALLTAGYGRSIKMSHFQAIENQSREDNTMAEKETETLGTPGEASLVISHVSKRYGNADHLAVTDFSISLHGGHIYGFLGKNGAGKSTIIKSVVGLHGFEEGTISICGYDVVTQPTEAKMCIGYVPDNYALYENLTGRQYVSYIADLYRVSRKDREARVPDLLKRLEMEAHFDMPMKTYSHGMKQKITIIAALVHEPKIWILDEPMTGLDPNSIFQIKELMRSHAEKGNIVFFSSHIIDVVENLCDEVVIIKRGHLIETDPVADLKAKGVDLETLFLQLTSDSEEEAKSLIDEEKKFDKKGA